MINICFLVSGVNNHAPFKVLFYLASNLPKEKYRAHLVTLRRENDPRTVSNFVNSGIPVYEFNYRNRQESLLRARRDLQKFCKNHNIDIIHSHTPLSDYFASKISNVRTVATVHVQIFEAYPLTFGSSKGKYILKWHLSALRKVDRAVCCCKSAYNELQKHTDNACAAPNGVPSPAPFAAIRKESLGLPSDCLAFIFAGRFDGGKNTKKLIELFAENRDENDYLLMLGDGVDLLTCKEMADKHVLFFGFVDDPAPYFAISDVYLSASLTEGGRSLSQLESLSHGLIQLVSDIPSHKEVVETDPLLGYTFTEETFSQLFGKVKQNVSRERKEAIKGIFESRFSVTGMVKAYEEIYSSLPKKTEKRASPAKRIRGGLRL